MTYWVVLPACSCHEPVRGRKYMTHGQPTGDFLTTIYTCYISFDTVSVYKSIISK